MPSVGGTWLSDYRTLSPRYERAPGNHGLPGARAAVGC
jgi:hypothetical protein